MFKKALVGQKRRARSLSGDDDGSKLSIKKYACEFFGCMYPSHVSQIGKRIFGSVWVTNRTVARSATSPSLGALA